MLFLLCINKPTYMPFNENYASILELTGNGCWINSCCFRKIVQCFPGTELQMMPEVNDLFTGRNGGR